MKPYRIRSGVLGAMLCLATFSAAAAEAVAAPVTTIAALDVARYMGTWYEIAKYPNRFQRKCVADTQADYRLLDDGTVQVTNRCRMQGGDINEAQGVARQVGGADSPKLEVRFAPAWLAFLPWVWGDYWVVDLDRDYSLVAVSEPEREYLWVLSRTPKVDAERYNALLGRLLEKGFDLDRLERSRQGD